MPKLIQIKLFELLAVAFINLHCKRNVNSQVVPQNHGERHVVMVVQSLFENRRTSTLVIFRLKNKTECQWAHCRREGERDQGVETDGVLPEGGGCPAPVDAEVAVQPPVVENFLRILLYW